MITLLGFVLSAFVSYSILFKHLELQTEIQNKKERDIANLYVDRIYLELVYNLDYLSKIQVALGLVHNPNREHWEWMVSLTDSFIFDSYDALMRSGFQKHIPAHVEARIYASFINLKYMLNLTKSMLYKYKFYEVYSSPMDVVGSLEEVKTYIEGIRPTIEDTLSTIKKYRPVMREPIFVGTPLTTQPINKK